MRLLYRSFFVRLLLVTYLIALAIVLAFPHRLVVRLFDTLIIIGGLAYLIRFARPLWGSFRAPSSDSVSVYMNGVALMIFNIVVVRLFRVSGWDQVTMVSAGPIWVALFATMAATAVFLLAIAPPLRGGTEKISPYGALSVASILAIVATIVLELVDKFFGLS